MFVKLSSKPEIYVQLLDIAALEEITNGYKPKLRVHFYREILGSNFFDIIFSDRVDLLHFINTIHRLGLNNATT
jgi:SET domain-containing protein